MLTETSTPQTIDDVQDVIRTWFGTCYKEANPPYKLSRKSDTELEFVSYPTDRHVTVEMNDRILHFQVKQARLNLDLERFLVSSKFTRKNLILVIMTEPALDNRLLISALRDFTNTKYPAFCARLLRVVKGFETDLTTASINEAIAAPTDQLVLVEAISAAPWVEELINEDPILAAKYRGVELRREMLKNSGGALNSGTVAELLNVSRQAVDKRRAANQLLALTQGRRGYSYPSFQFEDGQVLDGLEDVLKGLSALDPWMQLRFFTTPDERLENKTPIDALRNGRIDDVVRIASGYGEQGSV